jgi:Cu/Ag efflux protein CusF
MKLLCNRLRQRNVYKTYNKNLEVKKMKKVLFLTIVLAISVALFTACTQPAVQPNPVPPQENITAEPTTPPSGNPSAKLKAEAEDAQGKLNGWIDNNSVEIELTPSDTLAFRVTDVLPQLEGIKDGDMVKFSYKANDQGQMIVTKIEKLQ